MKKIAMFFLIAMMATTTNAAISSVTPNCSIAGSSNGVDLSTDQTIDDILIPVFNEKQEVELSESLTTDDGVVIPAGTNVNSYLAHMDPDGIANPAINYTGSVTFDRPVLGVIYTEDSLEDTDPILGNASAYKAGRKLNPGDNYSLIGNTLTLNCYVSSGIDEIRIVELIPHIVSRSPVRAYNRVGTSHTVTFAIDYPIASVPVDVEIISGPHAGISETILTDENGEVEFEYFGEYNGHDIIIASCYGIYPGFAAHKYWLENYVTGGSTLKDDKKPAWTLSCIVGYIEGEGIVGECMIVDHVNDMEYYLDPLTHLEFYGDTATSPVASNNVAVFVGRGSPPPNVTYFRVRIEDLGESKKEDADTVKLERTFPGPLETLWEGEISTGNFQVHDMP